MNSAQWSSQTKDALPIDTLLEDHNKARQHIEELGLLPLSPALKGTIWGLRLYVLFMIVVVVMNIIQNLH
ncbi:hypothetical protein [Sulfobacillus thermosulfidooxidans]|uniref:hypothetical protein n=1 Tax=Sulfobacillus thermosulfidooxidans TaxID=28034 RepID=UPI00096B7896|nr:hypothetical protein [Sulfobacillus thermosulfidooxidans]OLZ10999.1 hypothetical protein BFX05_09715 [Sulfobacillus thermosulfidooxidans]OLZ14487.1 hypothetical protein BFX06_09540 [Sulfobacillus thermosulfidooxidans]OLZ19230.1 hypothetical protein BFX07_05935 [Sulfobacillus thermosulfidooxidans]